MAVKSPAAKSTVVKGAADACPVCRETLVRAQRWRNLRFTLGMIEMGGAIFTAVLLLSSGPTTETMTALLTTTSATIVSVLLFGGRRSMK
jgi:hypothetical protein